MAVRRQLCDIPATGLPWETSSHRESGVTHLHSFLCSPLLSKPPGQTSARPLRVGFEEMKKLRQGLCLASGDRPAMMWLGHRTRTKQSLGPRGQMESVCLTCGCHLEFAEWGGALCGSTSLLEVPLVNVESVWSASWAGIQEARPTPTCWVTGPLQRAGWEE